MASLISRRCLAQTRLAQLSICRYPIALPLLQSASRASPNLLSLSPAAPSIRIRPFSATSILPKGIMPDSSLPTTKDHPAPEQRYVVASLSDSEYHDLADRYLDNLLLKFEQLQESREDIDVEYASGVMTITVAEKGTFVINKQPPNKQIWLSSPLSGPKRYDWSVVSEGQGDKEGTAIGYWTYARDGSTLDELILRETGVDVGDPENSPC